MKLGVFTVSMPDYDPMQALAKLAELGYDGVEWRVCQDSGDKSKPSFWSGNRTSMTAAELSRNADSLKAKVKALGLEMPGVGAYIDARDPKAVEEHLAATAAIGARNVRIGPGGYDAKRGAYLEQLAESRRRFATVAQLAAKHGVRAVIETHMGLLTPTVTKTMEVLRDLDPRHVGIMWDPGNQVVEGREIYSMAIENAGPYLAEVHAKNMGWIRGDAAEGRVTWKTVSMPLREGMVDWPEAVAALKRAGYNGWIHLEDFSTVYPLEERLRGNLAWFRELLAR
jgi:sugar phosphate isomerase/epimerase